MPDIMVNSFDELRVKVICDEINSIDDPFLLHVYMKAIMYRRCKIGTKTNVCKDCVFRSDVCREINNQLRLEERYEIVHPDSQENKDFNLEMNK